MVASLRVEEWHSVHQRLRALAKRRAELDAEEARCLREAERVQLWRWLGYIHIGEYLERELGYAPHAGAERLRVARALADLPEIEAALGQGALHYSAVRELSRIATRETEAEWLAAARGKNVRQVEAAVSGRKRGDRPQDPTRPELVSRVVRLELLPDVFALFRQTQAALADEHGGRLDDNAFIQTLCRRAMEGSGPVGDARPAHQISITVCESCKRGWQNGAGREIEVGPAVIERAQCDTEHIGSLEAAQPARVTATVTPRLRRQVLARDHHRCTVPGCRSARNLDLHHIQYQSDGGSNEIGNLTTLCTGHHQRLHEGALSIRGRAPDGLEFRWCEPGGPVVDADSSRGGPEASAPAPRVAAHEGVSGEGPTSRTPWKATSGGSRQSHVGPEVSADMQRGVTPAVSVQSHVGPEVSADMQRGVTPAVSVQSHVGPEEPAPTISASFSACSDGGPGAAAPSGLRASASVGSLQSHRGPEATSPSISTSVAAQSDGKPQASADMPRSASSVESIQRRGILEASRSPSSVGSVPLGRFASVQGRPAVVNPSSHAGRRTTATSHDHDIVRDVRFALTTAGYKPHEAQRAVEEARARVGTEVGIEQLLREALRCCARPGERHLATLHDGSYSPQRS